MWFLTRHKADSDILNGDTSSYYLRKEITLVGRKTQDLAIQDDDSISRNHAKLILEDGKLFLQDEKSKYGTFLFRVGLATQKALEENKVELEDGDKIRFGRFSSIFIVNRKKFRSATSGLTEEEKSKLSEIFSKMGIEESEDLDENCTHLTVPYKTTITKKLLIALSSCKPVINIKFWISMLKAFESNTQMPNYEDFLPIVEESHVSPCPYPATLSLNFHRRQLFAGKTFIFASSTQMSEYDLIIKSGGGKVLCFKKKQFGRMRDFVEPNTIFIQPSSQLSCLSQTNENNLKTIQDLLISSNRRMVPEIEISLAVINVSTAQWCNPCFKTVKSLFTGHDSRRKKASPHILVEATSNIDIDSVDKSTSLTDNEIKMANMSSSIYIPETESQQSLQSADIFVEESEPLMSNLHPEESIDIIETDFGQNDEDENPSNSMREIQETDEEVLVISSADSSRSKKRKNENCPTQESELLSSSNPKRSKRVHLESIEKTSSEVVLLSQSSEPSRSIRTEANYRKRHANNSNLEDDLFNFNCKDRKNKRLKKNSDSLQSKLADDEINSIPSNEFNEAPRTNENIRKNYSYNEESSDSSTWIDRKLNSIRLNESHQKEMDATENHKNNSCIINDSVFKIVDYVDQKTSANSSRGKSFVKKHQYSKQGSTKFIITMKRVET